MKRLVVYQSSTGFTQQYAEWIAKELNCEANALKNVSKQVLSEYEMIVFGGWLMGNTIMGLDKVEKACKGKLIVFAVGASERSGEVIHDVIEANHLGDLPFFYMQGGIQFEKLDFVKRNMLSLTRKKLAKKQNKTSRDIYMEKALSASFNASDRRYIKLLVDFLTVD